ncbi:hypothetical protein PhaeoP83_00067 [Phaeobacter inhibens]|uniref:Uncharacterized protein n=1 Tax=Phaeobacter inhibens TaxID=221822 RepID=A0ABM6R9E0_9RHOB|nr:hypothetical protein PhaeoP83_00067 [Phaeobacter inhibens]AUQ55839.1 hypothetical protein PhaeoP92_03204 [Phaeobacter inhibens]AUQ79855.1 hypothetical protein PhaeoP74_03205 [Phaeobacter inhibens]AUQ92891.1 hypothetical protein PhaeoP66_00060 [Phaeobacter inhibens]AUR17014.1 hypothetical protein PhaeoP70_03203 [Phaeobacter inhibens]
MYIAFRGHAKVRAPIGAHARTNMQDKDQNRFTESRSFKEE